VRRALASIWLVFFCGIGVVGFAFADSEPQVEIASTAIAMPIAFRFAISSFLRRF
jgi:hypothetical protein